MLRSLDRIHVSASYRADLPPYPKPAQLRIQSHSYLKTPALKYGTQFSTTQLLNTSINLTSLKTPKSVYIGVSCGPRAIDPIWCVIVLLHTISLDNLLMVLMYGQHNCNRWLVFALFQLIYKRTQIPGHGVAKDFAISMIAKTVSHRLVQPLIA